MNFLNPKKNELSEYLFIIFGIFALITAFWVLETYFPTIPGIYILGLDIVIQLTTGIAILFSKSVQEKLGRTAKIFLSLMFFSFAFADTAWTLAFYILKLNSRDPFVSVPIAGGYSLGFLFGTIGLLFSLETNLKRFLLRPLSIVIGAITIPVAIRFLIVPFIQSVKGSFFTPFNIGEIVAIITSLAFLNVGLIGLLSSRNLFWSVFCSGVVSIIFGDWAMRVEKILDISPAFGYYEYFWAFGVYISATPFLFFKKTLTKLESFDSSSLLSSYKIWTVILIFISIVFLSLSQFGNLAAIKFISISCGLGAVITALVCHFLSERVRYFSELLGKLVTEQLKTKSKVETPREKLPLELDETYHLVFEKRIEQEKQKELQEVTLKIAKTKAETARQVAHDIRSPLAALTVAYEDLTQIPENQRVLVRSAIARIQDIANNLIDSHKVEDIEFLESISGNICPLENEETLLISPCIDSIVSEKRLQFRSRLGVLIEAHLDARSYGLFARVQPKEFKRILSNLTNNSVEAIKDKGKVVISVYQEKEEIILKVEDTGHGISEEILPKLMQKGASFGKENGNGIGLYHAKTFIDKWNGKIEIESKIGIGTTVTIKIPKANSPIWFVPRINLNENSKIVILDDDLSIHQIWKNRFSQVLQENPDIQVFNLSTGQELKNWAAQNKTHNVVFLIDFELLGQEQTGIDLIKELEIGELSILVTSRFEEPFIIKTCEELGIGLIPKAMSGLVPIKVQPKNDSLVLIDDDELVHLCWEAAAEKHGRKVIGFKNGEEFFKIMGSISKSTPIYVDLSIEQEMDGVEISKRIKEKGFENIFVTTGYSKKEIPTMSWVSKIVGKSPEFFNL